MLISALKCCVCVCMWGVLCQIKPSWSLGESTTCKAQGDYHTHTHQTHEGEISHHTISMAITKTSVSAAWRKELQGVCECMSVCWDWTGAIFPLVLTGIVLGLDGWVSGFGLVQAVSYVFVWMHVFTYLPLCSSVPPQCFYQLKLTHHYTPTHFHIIHDIMCMTLCDSPCVFIWLYIFSSSLLLNAYMSVRLSLCQSKFRCPRAR